MHCAVQRYCTIFSKIQGKPLIINTFGLTYQPELNCRTKTPFGLAAFLFLSCFFQTWIEIPETWGVVAFQGLSTESWSHFLMGVVTGNIFLRSSSYMFSSFSSWRLPIKHSFTLVHHVILLGLFIIIPEAQILISSYYFGNNKFKKCTLSSHVHALSQLQGWIQSETSS